MTEVRFEKRCGVSVRWVKRIVDAALRAEKSRSDVSVLVTDDKRIRKVNRAFLKHDYATDVLSFPAGEPGTQKHFLGDVVVSADTAGKIAREMGLPFRQELARYLVHGTLHLLGYDDQNEKDRAVMHARQEALLKKIL